ncbi:MAG: cobalamin biosynthesis protein CbiX [Betaproteobacteria bacterium]|nr:cobalamin biosynthesis protein CbiX [Betaproteobacteria bacterium]NBY18193.1 cobalamin biosynthesis protein CbiX [Betaproteobacteria bacterium]
MPLILEFIVMSMPVVILFAHGARDPAWAQPFHALRAALLAARPEGRVELAFLELMEPGLPDLVATLANEGVNEIVVVPVFLGRGGHLRRDFPVLMEAARARAPAVTVRETLAVGELPAVIAAMSGAILGVLEE